MWEIICDSKLSQSHIQLTFRISTLKRGELCSRIAYKEKLWIKSSALEMIKRRNKNRSPTIYIERLVENNSLIYIQFRSTSRYLTETMYFFFFLCLVFHSLFQNVFICASEQVKRAINNKLLAFFLHFSGSVLVN